MGADPLPQEVDDVTPDLLVAVRCDADDMPRHAVRIDVENPTGSIRLTPGPETPEIMFRETDARECPPLGYGFKLYGLGRWPAERVGDPVSRRWYFRVAAGGVARLIDRLACFGWVIESIDPDLNDLPRRWREAKDAADIRPPTINQVLRACGIEPEEQQP